MKQQQPEWRHYHPHLHRFFKWTGRGVLVLAIAALIAGLAGTVYVRSVISKVPDVTEEALRSDPSSNMYAANGELIWSSAKNRRVYVERDDIPDTYIDMLLATEQKTFYEDRGFSPTGLANAFVSVIQKAIGQGEIRGGSSLEQQLIKLTVFSTGEEHRNVERKIQEFYLANQLYENYDKEEILEFYVNKLPLSENSFGAQTLSKTYYNKSMSELSPAKIALLVGTGQAPSAYNVYSNPEKAEQRRDTVLYIAHEDGILSDEEYQKALDEPIDDGLMPRNWQIEQTNKTIVQHDAYVQQTLKEVSELGYNLEETPLQIHTALDVELNTYLKDLFDNQPKYFQGKNQQAAATIIENKTGHVLAQIGGRHNTEISSYNRATQKVRSTGSSTKPFFYAAGMEKLGWGTNKAFDGSNYKYAGTSKVAYNYGMQQVGVTSLQNALRNSFNTTILRAYDQVGREDVVKTLRKVGLNVKEDLTSSNALGVEGSTEEVATAYSTLSNMGVKKDAQYITKLVFPDKSEKTIEQVGEQAINESTAYMLLHTLKGVSYLDPKEKNNAYIDGLPQAMKTGTVGYPDSAPNPSSTAMDLWTAGTTPSISLAIWHGYDTPMDEGWLYEDTMRQKKFDLYRDIMKEATKGYENPDWKKPDSAIAVSGSGLSAHYKPATVNRSYFDGPQTSKKLTESTVPYFGSKDDVFEVQRGDDDFEQTPNDYEFGGWQHEVDKRNEEIDKEVKAVEEEQSDVEAEWEKERSDLDAEISQERSNVEAVRERYNERVSELERQR